MGAWGLQFDENDDAADWLSEFEDAPSWDPVRYAFQQVQNSGDEYLESPECCIALSGAEVVAAGLGKPSSRLSEELISWARKNVSGAKELSSLAHQAVSRVRSESELFELWQESDEAEAWLATVDDLLNRLQ